MQCLNAIPGIVGFEPTNVGVKDRCVTASPYPIVQSTEWRTIAPAPRELGYIITYFSELVKVGYVYKFRFVFASPRRANHIPNKSSIVLFIFIATQIFKQMSHAAVYVTMNA